MIARYVAIAATLVLLAACSGSDETLTDSAGSAAGAAGAGIGTTDTTGGWAPAASSARGRRRHRPGAGRGTQTDLEVNVGDRVFFDVDSSTLTRRRARRSSARRPGCSSSRR